MAGGSPALAAAVPEPRPPGRGTERARPTLRSTGRRRQPTCRGSPGTGLPDPE